MREENRRKKEKGKGRKKRERGRKGKKEDKGERERNKRKMKRRETKRGKTAKRRNGRDYICHVWMSLGNVTFPVHWCQGHVCPPNPPPNKKFGSICVPISTAS